MTDTPNPESYKERAAEARERAAEARERAAEARELVEALEEKIAATKRAKAEQPARLAEMREKAEEARNAALAAEPWSEMWGALPTYNLDGDLTGMMAIPSIDAKELFGTRLALDLLGCCDGEGEVMKTLGRYFAMTKDTGHMMLIAVAALSFIAEDIMPATLRVVEEQASRYDLRVNLADAARNAWAARVGDLKDHDDHRG